MLGGDRDPGGELTLWLYKVRGLKPKAFPESPAVNSLSKHLCQPSHPHGSWNEVLLHTSGFPLACNVPHF